MFISRKFAAFFLFVCAAASRVVGTALSDAAIDGELGINNDVQEDSTDGSSGSWWPFFPDEEDETTTTSTSTSSPGTTTPQHEEEAREVVNEEWQLLNSNIDLPPGFSSCATQNDNFWVTSATLDPFPPKKGQTLSATIRGNVVKTIEKGSGIKVVAKLGFVPVWFTNLDLCDSVKPFGINCPITPDSVKEITFKTDIPSITPSIPVNIEISAKTGSGNQIICINGRFTAA